MKNHLISFQNDIGIIRETNLIGVEKMFNLRKLEGPWYFIQKWIIVSLNIKISCWF